MGNDVEVSKKLKQSLPKEIFNLIRLIDKLAQGHSFKAFLVGGIVRDALLGIRNYDLDFVVEGDAPQLASAFAKEKGGNVVIHKRFGTATAVTATAVTAVAVTARKIKVDFATARKETYEAPAALPTVEFGTIIDDLSRRDFTINAMAMGISGDNFGRIIDFFGGRNDLAEEKIRILHDASFIDDPTRIIRAVRFEQRFGFRIEPRTESLLKQAARRGMLERTHKHRLRDELVLVLKEERPARALKRLQSLAGLGFIHPGLRFTGETERIFSAIEKTKNKTTETWVVYLIALLDHLSAKAVRKVCGGFAFRREETRALSLYKERGPAALKVLESPTTVPPSRVYNALEPLPIETISALAAKTSAPAAKRRIHDFLERYRHARLKINGRDLARLGLKPGPRFKTILAKTLCAKLDRGFSAKAQEVRYAKGLAGRC